MIKNLGIGKNEYLLREINNKDELMIQDLFNRCYDYFELIEGRRAEENAAKDFLGDLPPGKELKDKHTYGVFDHEKLISVIELVENFPEENEWIIGLMLIDPKYRGMGIGKTAHSIIADFAADNKANKLRIGVVEQNEEGLKFWKKVGYGEVSRTEPRKFGEKECVVIVMNYYL